MNTQSMSNSLQSALKYWLSILQPSQVIDRSTPLEDYNQTTFITQGNIECVLLPNSTKEVSQCLEIANQYEISVYVVSKGKNYGLGSKLPVVSDIVVIDLANMNKIVDFSEKLAYITVEPGVTFKQVSDYLITNESELMLDSIGSTGEASIIGNTAERGHGVALLADRFNYTCAMEVVLPSGEVINTGFSAWENASVSSLSKWGVGPSIDGLFTQSNLGVITKLSLWLQPKPAYFQIILFQIENDENLGQVIEIMRKIKLQQLSISLRIFNDYRMIGFSQQYPWEAMGGKTPLSQDVFKKMKAEGGIKGKWIGMGALYSIDESFGSVEKAYLEKQLAPHAQVTFYDEKKAADIKNNGTEAEQDFIDFIFFKSSLRGFTSERALNMCYWRMKTPIPEDKDLHRDGCGVLWYCPAIPNTAEDVEKAVTIIEKTSAKYNLEPNIGFLYISDRVLDITGAICFDKTDPKQDKLAKKCHDEIMEEFIKAGYPPYRLGIQSMHLTSNIKPENMAFLKQLKMLIDPKNILSRGRYIDDK